MLKIIFIFIILESISDAASEYIPVFMWENIQEKNRDSDLVSPLQKMNQDIFQFMISKKLRDNTLVLLFIEESLSPEDFMLHNMNGKTTFPYLSALVGQLKVSYLPQVEDPLRTLIQMTKESPITTIPENMSLDRTKFITFNLNDTIEMNRARMFARHDLTISRVFTNHLKMHDNILAIFTARHAYHGNFVYRTSKKLLQTAENASELNVIVDDKNLLLITSGDGEFSEDGGATFTKVPLSQSDFSINDKIIKVTLSGDSLSVQFSIHILTKYWKMEQITMNDKNLTIEEIEPPLNFSYHCSMFTLKNKKSKEILKIPGFQIQPFKGSDEKKQIFGPAYDCTGYTTVPILSGIMVCTLFLSILFYGIISMMDIKVMDKFENPKGKPFYVVVEH